MTTDSVFHIAIVDDDAILREEISLFLRSEGFNVHEAESARELDELLIRQPLDAAVLDIGLPGESGIELARRLRRHHQQPLGILMLTARTGVPDRVASYEAGADIYLPKPVAPLELVAALRGLLRRFQASKPDAHWTLILATGELHAPGKEIPVALGTSEARLLRALSSSLSRSVPGHALCAALAEPPTQRAISRRALENKVSRLRQKILTLSPNLPHGGIRSDWQYGYQLLVSVRLADAQHAAHPSHAD